MSDGGAIYSPQRRAAKCPECGTWVARCNTYSWHRGIRVRRHSCIVCNLAFKSTETDPTYEQEKVAA